MATPAGPPASPARARLASVYRTVDWVVRHPDRMTEVRFLALNCGRLMDEAIGLIGEDADDHRAVILKARALLAGFDGRPQEGRVKILESLRLELERVVPAEDRQPPPISREEGAEEAEVEPTSDEEAAAVEEVFDDEASQDEATIEEQDEGTSGGDEGARGRGDGEPTLEQLMRQWRREQAPQKRSRKRRDKQEDSSGDSRFPLGHPDGTGQPVSALPGLSSEAVAALERAGIRTIADVLLTPVASHERYPLVHPGTTAPDGNVTVRGRLRLRCQRIGPKGSRWEAVLEGRNATLRCVWVSGPPHSWTAWKRGQELAMVGTIESTDAGPVMYEGEPVGIDGRGSGFMPLYGIEGLDDRVIRRAAATALMEHENRLQDTLPSEVRNTHRLLEIGEALRECHFPSNNADRGRVRLAFEELYLLQLGILWGSRKTRGGRGYSHTILHKALGDLQLQKGISLDDGQEAAFDDIRRDLLRPRPMVRLLQGDVGAGKGLVGLVTAAVVAENKSQVALVYPDHATAERRYMFAEPLLRMVGVVPMLVDDEPSHAQLDALRRGETHVAFGTSSLIGDIGWRRLGLVVVEERDRHGTVRPEMLPSKGARPDLLVMTQAPVPTSLVFTVYRDFDVTVVPTSHRLRTSARLFDASDREMAYDMAREQLEDGRQIYVVFPVDGDQDLLSMADGHRFADALRRETFPDARIGVFSSQMSRDERLRVFDDFMHRRVDILVCTSPIEDAPSVANATVVVAEHADRFDLIRLHRLRGFVGHGVRPGRAIFVLSEKQDDEDRRRIDLVVVERDGFRIAELDLQARGYEEILGDRAKEAPRFRYIDPVRDRELLLRARREAAEGARNKLQNASLVRAAKERWGDWFDDIDIDVPKPGSKEQKSGGRRRRRRRRRK